MERRTQRSVSRPNPQSTSPPPSKNPPGNRTAAPNSDLIRPVCCELKKGQQPNKDAAGCSGLLGRPATRLGEREPGNWRGRAGEGGRRGSGAGRAKALAGRKCPRAPGGERDTRTLTSSGWEARSAAGRADRGWPCEPPPRLWAPLSGCERSPAAHGR